MSAHPRSILVKRDQDQSTPPLTSSSSMASVELFLSPSPYLHSRHRRSPRAESHKAPLHPTSPTIAMSPAFCPFRTSDFSPPRVEAATALFVGGQTVCPDARELVFCPELKRGTLLERRWTWRQEEVEVLLEHIAAAEVDTPPSPTDHEQHRRQCFFPSPRGIPILALPIRPPPQVTSTYSTINGRPPPMVSSRTSSILALASPTADDEYDLSDSETRDYHRRQAQTSTLVTSRPAGASTVRPGSSRQSASARLRIDTSCLGGETGYNGEPTDPTSYYRRFPSPQLVRHTVAPPELPGPLRRRPHQPPAEPFRSHRTPRKAVVSFKPRVRVAGGAKPRLGYKHGQKPMPRITCASDYLRLNLLDVEGSRRASSDPGPSRQFYLANHHSNQSSANSSCVSFEHPTNYHDYVPCHHPGSRAGDVPRRVVIPPGRPSSPPRPQKDFTPAEDWMWQRLLDGYDSDDDSRWSWHAESEEEEEEDDEDDIDIEEAVTVLEHHRPPHVVSRVELRAREDAAVLHAHVDTWRTKLDPPSAPRLKSAEFLARIAATHRAYPTPPRRVVTPGPPSPAGKPRSALVNGSTKSARTEDRYLPLPVRFDPTARVREVLLDEPTGIIETYAQALATGLGISLGPEEYNEELKIDPPRNSRLIRRSTVLPSLDFDVDELDNWHDDRWSESAL